MSELGVCYGNAKITQHALKKEEEKKKERKKKEKKKKKRKKKKRKRKKEKKRSEFAGEREMALCKIKRSIIIKRAL